MVNSVMAQAVAVTKFPPREKKYSLINQVIKLIRNGCWNCVNRTKKRCALGCRKDKVEPFYFIDATWRDVETNINGKLDNVGVVVGSGCENLDPKNRDTTRERVKFD